MRERYISVFKKIFVIISLLLVIVCFLLGSSYSNFIYSSNNHRAVEMIVNELNYKVIINNTENDVVKVKPGINIYSVEIDSLNNTDTYFKLLASSSELNYFYLDNSTSGLIKSNDKYYTNILISNDSEETIDCKLIIGSGFINNTVDDIVIPSGYKEIKNKLSILDNIKFDSYDFKILDINNDGSMNIMYNNTVNTNQKLIGRDGYNNSNDIISSTINNMFNNSKILELRNVSIEDIEKYTNNKIVSKINKQYNSQTDFFTSIDTLPTNSIVINETVINNNLSDSIYNEVFLNMNYILSNTFSRIEDNILYWGILCVNNNKIEYANLYNSNNENYEKNIYLRPIIKLSNKINIRYEQGNIIVE